jgi:hypothetical protein
MHTFLWVLGMLNIRNGITGGIETANLESKFHQRKLFYQELGFNQTKERLWGEPTITLQNSRLPFGKPKPQAIPNDSPNWRLFLTVQNQAA